jgi:alpha-ribazole phosphatase
MSGQQGGTVRWWWVRHAPVPDGGRIYGQHDLDCDCSEEHIFAAVAKCLPTNALWITSHLARTKQTATALRAAMGGAGGEPVVVPEFAEQHLGEWQGLARKEFFASREQRHHFWFGPANEQPPGGESFGDLVERAKAAIVRLTREHADRDIIAVGHGGTIKAALALALELDPEACLAFVIDNCSITRLDYLGGDARYHWRVAAVNHRPWADAQFSGQSIRLA